MDKKQIRKLISEKKKQMTSGEIEDFSEKLADIFFGLPEYASSGTLFAYVAYNQEVRTQRIIEQALADGKRVAVPRVEGKDLEFRLIDSLHEFLESPLGISEPMDHHPKAMLPEEPVLMLMPGLAFDRRGFRIGYGKGLYDRYLARVGKDHFIRIALCYDFQLLEHEIAADEFDIPVDKLICAPSFTITDIR